MKLSRKGRVVGVALALALAATACSDGDQGGGTTADAGSGDLTGTLNGVGSSAQTAAVQAWKAGFEGANSGVTVNYDPQGSGAGREQFIAGAVDFAGSDAALKEEELTKADTRCGGAAIDIPVYVSPIAVVYNLDGVTDLNLKPATIANIFNGTIKKWNDAAIKADNPSATLPDLAVSPVHREAGSGTTTNFTDYLSKASGGAWTFKSGGDWPIKGGEEASGTSGVISAVKAGKGAVGYADESQAGDLGTAAIGVGSAFVKPTAEAAAKTLSVSEKTAGRTQYDLAYDLARDTTEATAYPLILVSYQLACLQYDDAAKADLVKAWLTYVTSTDGQAAAASSAGSAPLPTELGTEAKASIDQIKAKA